MQAEELENGLTEPRWLLWMGVIAAPGTIFLCGRIIWEQTWLTWSGGLQMVGYSLSHATPGLFMFLLAFTLLACVQVLSSIVVVIARVLKGTPPPIRTALLSAALGCCLLSASLPYLTWISLLVRFAPRSPHQGEFLYYAAGSNDRPLVERILASGVPANSLDGERALNAACVGKHHEMASYLVSQGANLDGAEDCAWSPELQGERRTQVPGTSVEVR